LQAQVRATGAAAVIVTHSERGAAIADRTLVLSPQGLTPLGLAPRHGH
jgi:ABC-type lipoprotein export system ATPase subunit